MWPKISVDYNALKIYHWKKLLSYQKGLSGSRMISGSAEEVKGHGKSFPGDKQVVICGGGVMGAAVAYHLAAAGLGAETVLLESSRLLFI